MSFDYACNFFNHWGSSSTLTSLYCFKRFFFYAGFREPYHTQAIIIFGGCESSNASYVNFLHKPLMTLCAHSIA